jgi:hypothetical protein
LIFPVALATGESYYMRGLYSCPGDKNTVDALKGMPLIKAIASQQPAAVSKHKRPAVMHARALIAYLAMRRANNAL